MDDLIRRQDAIDAIKEFKHGATEWKDEQDERSDIWHRADSAIASALEIGLRVKKIPSAQQWIPCSERLPEKEGQYLVTLDFSWGKEIEMGDWFIFADGHGEWVNPNSHVTVAWMELPTPWKESEDKK